MQLYIVRYQQEEAITDCSAVFGVLVCLIYLSQYVDHLFILHATLNKLFLSNLQIIVKIQN